MQNHLTSVHYNVSLLKKSLMSFIFQEGIEMYVETTTLNLNAQSLPILVHNGRLPLIPLSQFSFNCYVLHRTSNKSTIKM